MPTVFVSYSRTDQEKANDIIQDIESLGYDVWFDNELCGGQQWWEKILSQIRDTDIFIIILSPASLDSTACKREYRYGNALGKPLIPVQVSNEVSVNLLPIELSSRHIVDYLIPNKEAAFRLLKAISSITSFPPLPDALPEPPEVPISYIGNIASQIDSQQDLSFQRQSSLLLEIKQYIQDNKSDPDALKLLNKFQNRRDIYVRIAKEINEIQLEIQADNSEPAKTRTDKTAIHRIQHQENLQTAYTQIEDKNKKMLIVMVVGLIILVVAGGFGVTKYLSLMDSENLSTDTKNLVSQKINEKQKTTEAENVKQKAIALQKEATEKAPIESVRKKELAKQQAEEMERIRREALARQQQTADTEKEKQRRLSKQKLQEEKAKKKREKREKSRLARAKAKKEAIAKEKAAERKKNTATALAKNEVQIFVTRNGSPYKATLRVTKNGKQVKLIRNQSFAKIQLPSGQYAVSAQHGGKSSRQVVTLAGNGLTQLRLTLDSTPSLPLPPVPDPKWTHTPSVHESKVSPEKNEDIEVFGDIEHFDTLD